MKDVKDVFTAVCGVTYVTFVQFVEKQTVIDNIEGGTKIEQHQYYGLPIIQQMKPVILYTNKSSFTTVSRTIRTEDFEDIVRVHVLPDLRCDFLLEKFRYETQVGYRPVVGQFLRIDTNLL